MTRETGTISPQVYARAGGVLYLIIILAGLFGEIFVRGKLMVPGDAAATAQKILASEFLFRSGIVGDLIMHLCDIPQTLIMYLLLRPVSKDLSLLAAVFGLVQTAVLVANKLNLVAALFFLEGGSSLHAFDGPQRQELASLALSLHEYGFGIGLVFFGVSCLFAGYLIYRSEYLPRTLGVLMGIAGVCYLINSFAQLLSPALEERMLPGILLPAFVGELATCLWLIVKGVNVAKWEERVRLCPVVRGITAD